MNATPTTFTVTFHGVDYELIPGADQTFDPTFGAVWLPGVHMLHTSLFGGAAYGVEIWLIAG